MFCYVLQLLCDLSTRNQISEQLRTSLRSGFSVGQQVTTGDRGWTSRQSVWIYLMTSARLDATDQFPCQEPVDKKLAHNWSLCMKIVHQFNINYWLAASGNLFDPICTTRIAAFQWTDECMAVLPAKHNMQLPK